MVYSDVCCLYIILQVQKSFRCIRRDGIHHGKNRGNKEIPLAIL